MQSLGPYLPTINEVISMVKFTPHDDIVGSFVVVFCVPIVVTRPENSISLSVWQPRILASNREGNLYTGGNRYQDSSSTAEMIMMKRLLTLRSCATGACTD